MKNKELNEIINDKLVKPLDDIAKEQKNEKDDKDRKWKHIFKRQTEIENSFNVKFKAINELIKNSKNETYKSLEENKKSIISCLFDTEKTAINAYNAIKDEIGKKYKNTQDDVKSIKNNVGLLEDTNKRKFDNINQRLGEIEHQIREINRNINELHSYLRTAFRK
jgi:predicted  nucleic acid-binding Zn-ribbon protein